jgi:hypothetical protein
MDFEGRRRVAAAMIVAVAAWFFMWFRRRVVDARSVTYEPMAERDRQRINNLRYIYESGDVNCVNLHRMRRAPFFQLVTFFAVESLLQIASMLLLRSIAMFLHVVGHN